MILWFKRAWVWLKEHWKQVLLGVATLGLGLVAAHALRRSQQVVSPELVEAEKKRREAQAIEDAKRLEAAKERNRRLEEIEEQHARTVETLTDQQKAKVDELKDNPAKLNDYLKSVGKDMRR